MVAIGLSFLLFLERLLGLFCHQLKALVGVKNESPLNLNLKQIRFIKKKLNDYKE